MKRSGRRFDAVIGDKKWGGSRQKKSQDSYRTKISASIHSGALVVRNDNIERSVSLFRRVQNDNNIFIEQNTNEEIETEENNNNGRMEIQNM